MNKRNTSLKSRGAELSAKRKSNAPSPFKRAIARFKQERDARRPARIGFIVDATSSREQTWREAQAIQARMFKALSGANPMALRLVHFGGGTLTDHGWETSARKTAARMAAVECVMGRTKILPALSLFLEDSAEEKASAVILVGDCFEEETQEVGPMARALAAAGIKVFAFIEGDDRTAAAAFAGFATITGGKFARFGADLPLADLCEGVALLAGGGAKAARKITNRKVKRLLLGSPDNS